jgi:hypothetical protein
MPTVGRGCKQYNTYLYADQIANLRLLATLDGAKEAALVRSLIDAYLISRADELRAAVARVAALAGQNPKTDP